MTIKWCIVPEWSMTDMSFWTIFCLFTTLKTQNIKVLKNENNAWRYYDFTHVHHKSQSYDVWFLRYWARQMELFVILDHFFLIYPLKTQKIKISKKWKKCPKNYNHMLYCSWDMARDRCNCYFSSFYTCVPKITIRWCTVTEKWCVPDWRTDGKSDT